MGVCNYPRKGKKKAARKEHTLVCIAHAANNENKTHYFIRQRPAKGDHSFCLLLID